jgi:hypothetical protein
VSADGTWTLTLKTPLGSQAATLQLATEGGAVSGHFESKLGSGKLANGSVDDDAVSWETELILPRPGVAHFAATFDGDVVSGTVDFGPSIGTGPFTGARS